MATYKDIADYFIAISNASGSLITNLKLQKLVYYAQAWHLGVYGEPIFDEDFQAWIHGPVLVALYDDYKDLKWRPIVRDDITEDRLFALQEGFSQKLNDLLNEVVDEYFVLDAYALEKSTHEEDPWIKARKGVPNDMPSNEIIDKKSMIEYYSQFVTQSN